MTEGDGEGEDAGRMTKRRTTLEDGRYLIYFTFDGVGEASGAEGAAAPEPLAEAEAAEERDV